MGIDQEIATSFDREVEATPEYKIALVLQNISENQYDDAGAIILIEGFEYDVINRCRIIIDAPWAAVFFPRYELACKKVNRIPHPDVISILTRHTS